MTIHFEKHLEKLIEEYKYNTPQNTFLTAFLSLNLH